MMTRSLWIAVETASTDQYTAVNTTIFERWSLIKNIEHGLYLKFYLN